MASGFSQTPCHWNSFFSRTKTSKMIRPLIKSTHKKKREVIYVPSPPSAGHKLLRDSPPKRTGHPRLTFPSLSQESSAAVSTATAAALTPSKDRRPNTEPWRGRRHVDLKPTGCKPPPLWQRVKSYPEKALLCPCRITSAQSQT